ITFCHLPFQSKWLYVGTERGNIHIVNVESFSLSGYVIMWNKAIELSSKSHPGPVVHISDNPMDEGKLLLGFESGIVVLWDLKSKKAEYRYTHDEYLMEPFKVLTGNKANYSFPITPVYHKHRYDLYYIQNRTSFDESSVHSGGRSLFLMCDVSNVTAVPQDWNLPYTQRSVTERIEDQIVTCTGLKKHTAIHSVAWHHEGKQFICSHSDGTLTIWNVRNPTKPLQTITPHESFQPHRTGSSFLRYL
ncbi:Syntaxin-binding protein 5, partial [Varanus komodoensis]